MTVIGFIGLGHMGHPMASNLIKAGYTVHVYDVSLKSMEAVAEQGGIPEKNIMQLVKQADVVMTSVQTGDQVKEICLSSQGIFNHAKSNLLYIDCSSIDISMTRALHQEAEKHHISMLDAPVSGGVAGAKAGSLTMMVGGLEDDFKRALPILNKLGKTIIHAGPAGSGQAAKICNNLLLGISMIGVCEAFILAKKLGLDPKKFFEISSHASGQCWSMTSYCPVPGILENVPANQNYQPGFTAKMMLKDLQLGEKAAASTQSPIPLGHQALALYESFVNQGGSELDFSGIITFLEKVI